MKIDAIIRERERDTQEEQRKVDRIERGDALSMEMHIHRKLGRKVN